MLDKLAGLIERAKRVTMSPDEQEAQRQSFAYGTTKIENELITRETVARQAARLRMADYG